MKLIISLWYWIFRIDSYARLRAKLKAAHREIHEIKLKTFATERELRQIVAAQEATIEEIRLARTALNHEIERRDSQISLLSEELKLWAFINQRNVERIKLEMSTAIAGQNHAINGSK